MRASREEAPVGDGRDLDPAGPGAPDHPEEVRVHQRLALALQLEVLDVRQLVEQRLEGGGGADRSDRGGARRRNRK